MTVYAVAAEDAAKKAAREEQVAYELSVLFRW
jgi:hypothetical protein